MKFLILALLISIPAQAKLKCAGDEDYSVMDVLEEKGCGSGLVLLNVETVCVDKSSPALSTLKAGKKFEICSITIPDPSKATWLAHVLSAAEAK